MKQFHRFPGIRSRLYIGQVKEIIIDTNKHVWYFEKKEMKKI